MAFSFKRFLKKDGGAVPAPTPLPKAAFNRADRQQVKGKVVTNVSPKKKSFRATSGDKYALIIGDDGAILVYVEGNVVKSRNFIAHASEENLKEFKSILSKNNNAPIFIIIDSMDQSFIQQSLPPISPLGVKKLIKRRLDRDLGADVIKGYVLLERDSSGRRDWNFLMVSLENSPNLKLWFDFIDKVDNRVNGIYLLSVETENVIKSIDLALGLPRRSKKNTDAARWKFFVSHNKVGGFRQVILKDDRIIFTRLIQPVGDVTAEVVAGNIEQEMASTVEYMKRLSFNIQQGLDIYVIASADINNVLDLSRILTSKIYKFTPFEVSEILGINGAAQPSDQFGDVIMSAYIACSKVHRLVLSLPKILKVNNLYNLVRYQRTLVGAAVLGMLSYGGMIGLGLMQKYSEIENLEQQKIIQQRKLDEINAEIAKSGIDIQKVSDTVVLYQQLTSESQSPLGFLSRIRGSIIASVTIREVIWQGAVLPDPAANVTGSSENMSLLLRFPEISGTDEAFKVVAKKVLRDVRAAFPEYEVVYTKLPDVISKKYEAGEIVFADKQAPVEIENNNLEATLLLTKKADNNVPNPAMPPGLGGISTDELIGLGKR